MSAGPPDAPDPGGDLYARLGVDPDASTDTIKDAYWRLAAPHHVVLAAVGTSGEARAGADRKARADAATEELGRLDEAYAVLVDPEARLRYHAQLAGVDLSALPAIVDEAATGLDLEVEVRPVAPEPLPTRPACVVCGGVPAVPVALKTVTGMLVHYRLEEVREALCARCGLATYRRMQARTLVRGWWGVFALLHNWAAIASNWAMGKRLGALPDPAGTGQWPDGSPRRPLDPGAPLWRRPKLLLAGTVVVALAVAAVLDTFVL